MHTVSPRVRRLVAVAADYMQSKSKHYLAKERKNFGNEADKCSREEGTGVPLQTSDNDMSACRERYVCERWLGELSST